MRRLRLILIIALVSLACLLHTATRADAQLCTGGGTTPVCYFKPFLWPCTPLPGLCTPTNLDIPLGWDCLCSTAFSPKCGPCKLKAAAKRYSCRLKALAKGMNKAEDPDFSKCDEKFGSDFQKCEDRKGPCVTEGDAAAVAAAMDGDIDELLESLGGASPMSAFLDGPNASIY